MTPRLLLVPIPAPLARALNALRRVQPSPALSARLRAALVAADDHELSAKKRKLLLLGGLALALFTELSPLVVAAQVPVAPVPVTTVALPGSADHALAHSARGAEQTDGVPGWRP